MDQLIVLIVKYRKVIKNAVLLSAVFVALFSKVERTKSLSLGVASGILLVELGESFDRARKTAPQKHRGE